MCADGTDLCADRQEAYFTKRAGSGDWRMKKGSTCLSGPRRGESRQARDPRDPWTIARGVDAAELRAIIIDYQPHRSGSIRSMDQDLSVAEWCVWPVRHG